MKISNHLLSEIRDFLQDISTGAAVTDSSRDAATEFVALLPQDIGNEPDSDMRIWRWLKAQANAEKEPGRKASFIEAANVALAIIDGRV